MANRLVAVAGLVGQVLTAPGDYSQRAPSVPPAGGLGAPAFKAFRARLEALLPPVLELVPHASVDLLRTPLLAEALASPALCTVTDDSLSGLLLQAATTGLRIGRELKPLVDRDPRTGQPIVVGVEGAAGLVRLLREAGAKAVSTGTVHAADHFRQQFADGERAFAFEPNLYVRDRGPVIAYFCVVDLRQGQWDAAVLSAADVEQRRLASSTPTHRAWTDYRDRMGECCAIRTVAAQLPQGALDPQRAGWTRPEPQDDAERVRPLGMSDDPYGAPEPAEFRVVDAEASRPAHLERLPGCPTDFEGWGGQRIGKCPTELLRRVKAWIEKSPARKDQYAQLSAAITHLLVIRQGGHRRPSSTR